MTRTLAIVLIALAPSCAAAQEGCLPPLEPYPYEPPRDDPELRQMIDEEYQAYIDDIEAYMRCLQDESSRAMTEAREVLQRWTKYYGQDAGMKYESGRGD